MLASRRFDSGAVIPVPDRAPVTVEFEIAYVLGRDIAPSETAAAPWDAVAEIRTTVELVRSRFVDRRAVGWAATEPCRDT